MTATLAFLERLVSMPTVSRDSNLELIRFVREHFTRLGIETMLSPSADGRKANLWATIGPRETAGIVLSGHTDVVPVDGQAWSSDPFRVRQAGDTYYGRGTADMKGFVASCLAMAERVKASKLTVPIHFAFSYDEEIGCVGVRRLLELLSDMPVKPRLCIVGEPTLMQAVTAHKGKLGYQVTAHGLEAHSSLAPSGVNAVYMAADLVQAIRNEQEAIAENGSRDADYEVPYTTLHVGRLHGGDVMNIVPNSARVDFEIRYLPQDDGEAISRRIRDRAETIAKAYRPVFRQARFEFAEVQNYPSLNTPIDSEAVRFVHDLTGNNSTGKITFGTEGGLFQHVLGVPAVVCGPGSIAVAHKPDEHISGEQLMQCDLMLSRLVERLSV